jgi:hypothetical protein
MNGKPGRSLYQDVVALHLQLPVLAAHGSCPPPPPIRSGLRPHRRVFGHWVTQCDDWACSLEERRPPVPTRDNDGAIHAMTVLTGAKEVRPQTDCPCLDPH